MLNAISKIKNTKITKKNDLGSPSIVIFNTVAIFLLSQFVAIIVASTLLALINRTGHDYTFDNSIPAQFVFVLIAEALAALIVLRIVRKRGLNFATIGLGRKPVLNDLLKALTGFIVFIGLVVAVNLIIELLFPSFKTDQKQELGFSDAKNNIDQILTFVSLVILPPIGEEILVRGYLFSGLRSKSTYIAAGITTSIIFAIAHLELGSGSPLVWGAAIQTFILSLVLVHLKEKTGALYSGMLLHFANNVIAFIAIYH